MPVESPILSEKNTHLLPRALELYRSHWREVSAALLPPSVIAYLLAWVLDQQIAEMRKALPNNLFSLAQRRGFLGLETAILPVQAWFLLKQWLIWICYCFAAVGVCVLVKRYRSGMEAGSYTSEFTIVREHPGYFLKSATLFFLMLILGFLCMMIIGAGLMDLQDQFKIAVFPNQSIVLGFLSFALLSAVMVRWVLAVPLATLQGVSFRKALRASDRLTDGISIQLWTCIMESEIAGYIAVRLPFWIAALALRGASLTKSQYYIVEIFSFFAFALAQAPLLISIGLILEESPS
jgi:hypothetical protein